MESTEWSSISVRSRSLIRTNTGGGEGVDFMITSTTDKQTENANRSQILKRKSIFTCPQVVLNPYDPLSSMKYKIINLALISIFHAIVMNGDQSF